jgi:spore maturation protein CgeB
MDRHESLRSIPSLSTGRARCFLVIDSGYFLVREIVCALQELGHQAVTLRLPFNTGGALQGAQEYAGFLKGLVEAVQRLRPDALLTVNHLGFDREGILTGLLAKMHLPALVWYVDSPRYIFQNPAGNASPWVGVFTWERSYLPWLKEMGLEHAHYLPLATDPGLFAGPLSQSNLRLWHVLEGNDPVSPLVFVGDSMEAGVGKALSKLPLASMSECSPEGSIPVRDVCEGFVDYTLEEGRDQPVWEVLSRLNPDMIGKLGFDSPELKLNFESLLMLMATRRRRTEFIQALASASSAGPLVIYGDPGWKKLLADVQGELPGRVQVAPAADYYLELPQIYHAAGAIVNLTSLQMPTALNQRCYDVPAAGGFLLTDQREAIAEQFEPDLEMVTFAALPELLDKWAYYRTHSRPRAQVIERARRRVLLEHTYSHRLREMLEVATSWFAWKF